MCVLIIVDQWEEELRWASQILSNRVDDDNRKLSTGKRTTGLKQLVETVRVYNLNASSESTAIELPVVILVNEIP